MTFDQLKPNKILRGPVFAEPVEVIVTMPMGAATITDRQRWMERSM